MISLEFPSWPPPTPPPQTNRNRDSLSTFWVADVEDFSLQLAAQEVTTENLLKRVLPFFTVDGSEAYSVQWLQSQYAT